MPESTSDKPLVWIDCEMTGLDAKKDTIMSLACFVTDAQLNFLGTEGFEAVIKHSRKQLDAMNQWCIEHHGQSGLTDACANSHTTEDVAAQALLDYIRQQVPHRGQAMLAGNTVHVDKEFLQIEPWRKVLDHLHYRILDVSTIKEAARRWASPEHLKRIPAKQKLHTAREDILESIEEARFYKKSFFQSA